MKKLKMQTLDAMESNVAKIAALFPQCVTERIGKSGTPELAIDFDKLRDELSKDLLDGAEERYQFTWPDKRAASRLANESTDNTLRPDVDASVDFWSTKNLYIEGDNLDVLKLLRENYLGAIKMIYIDPPYNTGNDFVYNDDFAQSCEDFEATSGAFDEEGNQLIDPMQRNTESNGRFHTDWLNMIYPRLKVARDLLSEDGAIFISIDDNEVENLRKVCNEIFGAQNFVAQISVIVKPEGRQYGYFAKTHEYVLVYAKAIHATTMNEVKIVNGNFKYFDAKGGFNTIGLRNRAVRIFNSTNRPNLRYPFYVDIENKDKNGFSKVSTVRKEGWQEVWASTVDGLESVWRWGKETAEKNKEELVAISGKDGEVRIFKKDRDLTTLPKTVWFEKEFNSIVGTREVASLIGKGLFDFPKPITLVKTLTEIASDSDSIILDFFSGSATTAHAVMKLNAEDGGKRKFIMVQLPEVTDENSEARKAGYETICQIGEERIRRAGKKIIEEVRNRPDLENDNMVKGLFEDVTSCNTVNYPPRKLRLPDVGFRVLKLDSSNMEDVFYTPEDFDAQNIFTTVDNVKPDRTPLDLLFQVLPELNIELSAKIEEKEVNGKKVFFVDGNYLIATFDTEVNESTVTEIAKMRPQYFVMRDASAANDNVLDNFEQIFRHYSPDTIRKIL